MLSDLKLVIRLQEIDNRLADLAREIATLPKHIAVIEKKLTSHERKLEGDRAALAANQKERKKCEGDMQIQEQKISKLKDQMLLAKTNEQYRAFQHEIDFCQGEIRKAEDRILELMTESEPLDANVKKAEVALKQEKVVVEEEKARARKRTAEDQGFINQHRGQRVEVVSKLPKDTVVIYDRVRLKSGGIAIAEVVNSRCQACQITIRPQYLQDLRKGTDLLRCEQCNRFLYINPPVSFEDVAAKVG